ncbi:hypothetical protein [Leifsonia sp. NPDC058230]|uniref:hypothetical protein n=1 Tax=Leifsonia sp. NPDC058230 TaxID=3346391 RepID=UPI0036D76349
MTVRETLARTVESEAGVWKSLYRFVFRRPRVPSGAVGFSYHKPIATVLGIFIVLSAVEIPIIDLIVNRWPVVRVALLVLGLWGLTFMVGLMLGFVTRPHSVGPDGIRARHGAGIDIPLAWDDVESVARERHTVESSKSPRLEVAEVGTILHLRVQLETNIAIRLERPTSIRLRGRDESVSEVRIFVDDVTGFMNEVRHHI